MAGGLENGAQERPVRPIGLAETFPASSLEDWKAQVIAELKGADYDKKLRWRTAEGIVVEPIHCRADAEGLAEARTLPGAAPFLRGTYPLSGVAPAWQIRQDSLLATPEEVNAALRDGIARGADAIGIRLDNAARQGLDGDMPAARELAGRGGCTISSINGMRIALADVDLARTPVTLRCGASSLPSLAILVALADERGVRRADLMGAVEGDPLRDLAKAGTTGTSLEVQWRILADMADFCREAAPGIRPVMVNSHAWHNAGATVTQELGIAMATGAEYVRQLIAHGLTPDEAGLATMFSMSVSTNLYFEIAKLRAARVLWNRVMEEFGAGREDARKIFLHARTSTANKTNLTPHNNIVRATIEAFAAVAGGCSSLYVAPYDEGFRRPDDFSSRIARNVQLLLRGEAHLDRVVDPLGGSYTIEKLTDEVARGAWEVLQGIEARGGMTAALLVGTPQQMVAEAGARREAAMAGRRESMVGVNFYANPAEELPEVRRIPRADFLAERQRRLARLKSVRYNSLVRELLGKLASSVVKREGNIVLHAIAAVEMGATIGEVTQAIRRADAGTPPEVQPLRSVRAASPYEDLRARAAAFRQARGMMPTVLLVPFGPEVMRNARAEFARGFFGAAGFRVEQPAAFASLAEAAAAVQHAAAHVVVPCSDDASYPAMVEALAPVCRDSRRLLYIAGFPADTVEALRAAGAHGFIHLKANAVQVLGEVLRTLESN